MNTPNTTLMELYGTDAYYMHKCGALSDAAYAALRGLAIPASIAAARANVKHEEELLFEAEQLNQRFREVQSARMSSVVNSLGGPSDPMHAYEVVKTSSALDPELEKIAQELGTSLAEMEKDALNFGQIAGFGKNLLGKATAGAGRLLERGGTKALSSGSTGRMLQAGASAPAKMPALQRIGQAATQGGANLAQKGTALAQRGEAQIAKATAGLKPPATPGPLPSAATAGPPPGVAGLTGAPIPGPAPAPSVTGLKPPPGVGGTPAVTAAGVPAAAPAAASAEQAAKKPLLSTGTKIGLGIAGAGAIGTAGVLGHTGLTAARDYMMVPSTHGGQTWGGYGPSPVQNVNQYGYVQPQL
jgi:hypothetical protein